MSKKKGKASEIKQKKTANPYKGLDSYKEEDEKFFYGRDEEKKDIIVSVTCNPLTVIYGKSGIGKTSLLNAGVFPGLREEGFRPVKIRLDYSGRAGPLLRQLRGAVKEEINKRNIQVKAQKGGKQAKPLNPDETLCDYFRRVSHFAPARKKPVILVLVFDQFEEFFTLGKAHDEIEKRALVDEIKSLSEFLYRTGKKSGGKNNKKKRGLLTVPFLSEVRLIIGLREDYFPDFTELTKQRDISDHGKFRVTYLTKAQALKIIGMPGGFQDDGIRNEILNFFSPGGEKNKTTETTTSIKLEIEPAFLSLLCFQLFEAKGLMTITRKDQSKILANFYDSEIRKFQDKVRKFVESSFLNERGFRTPSYLEPEHPLRKPIEKLVDRRILRRFHVGENEYFEIIHDKLVPAIKEGRNRRIEKRKKIIMILLAFIVLLLIATTTTAIYNKINADKTSKILRELNISFAAHSALNETADNTRAIRIASAAFEMGLPRPQPRTYQVLSAVGYSSFEKPFYSTMWLHSKPVNSAVLSPDNKFVLTACDDGTAKLWDLDGKLLQTFKHEKRVNSTVFSPDGKRVLTASWDRSARVWNLDGEELALFENDGIVETASFSPDGDRVLTASRDGTAKLWSLKGEMLVNFPFGSPLFSARFSDDGTRILTASWSKGVKLWDTAGQPLRTLNHDGVVISALFFHGSSEIMTASQDGLVNFWNQQGEITKNLKLNSELISVALSPAGDRLLTTSKDRKARIWDMQGRLLEEIQFDGELSSAVFTADESRILTASSEGIAKLSYLKNDILVDLDKHNSEINKALFSPDGNRILTASMDGTAKLWDLGGELLADLPHKGNVTDVAFSSTGKYIVTASEDRTAKLWSKAGKFIRAFMHDTGVSSAVFSPDEKKILTSSRDNIGILWDRDNDKKPLETAISDYDDKEFLDLSHAEGITIFDESSALFSPDGDWILTASVSGKMRLWSTKGKEPVSFSGHTGRIYSALFSHDGGRILTASEDGTAKLWEQGGELLADLGKHSGAVYSARFSKDDLHIITASEDGTAKLWKQDGKLLKSFNQHKKAVLFATFSHDDRRIITASEDGTAKLWDLKGNLLADLDKHTGTVISAWFSMDSQRILTASKDGTAKIWYTSEAIYRWLKKTKIPKLSEDEEKKLGIL